MTSQPWNCALKQTSHWQQKCGREFIYACRDLLCWALFCTISSMIHLYWKQQYIHSLLQCLVSGHIDQAQLLQLKSYPIVLLQIFLRKEPLEKWCTQIRTHKIRIIHYTLSIKYWLPFIYITFLLLQCDLEHNIPPVSLQLTFQVDHLRQWDREVNKQIIHGQGPAYLTVIHVHVFTYPSMWYSV